MKQLTYLCVLGVAIGLSGCKGSKPSNDVEVMAFKGGYDIDFYQKSADEFNAKNPGVNVTVDGDPHIWEKILTPNDRGNTSKLDAAGVGLRPMGGGGRGRISAPGQGPS